MKIRLVKYLLLLAMGLASMQSIAEARPAGDFDHFECLNKFTGEGKKALVAHFARLSTDTALMPRALFHDRLGYIEIGGIRVNYMNLLSLHVDLLRTGNKVIRTVALPNPTEVIFRQTFYGDFGLRRTWKPGKPSEEFQANAVEVICLLLRD